MLVTQYIYVILVLVHDHIKVCALLLLSISLQSSIHNVRRRNIQVRIGQIVRRPAIANLNCSCQIISVKYSMFGERHAFPYNFVFFFVQAPCLKDKKLCLGCFDKTKYGLSEAS